MFLGLIVLGCAEIKPSANMTADRKMQIADDFFQKEKYHKAVPFYSDLVFERNSIFTAEAQIKLANCYFSQNKFMEARFEYDELMRQLLALWHWDRPKHFDVIHQTYTTGQSV